MNCYLWNVDKAIQAVKREDDTKAIEKNHLALFFIFASISSAISQREASLFLNLSTFTISLIIVLGTIQFCFKINNKIDGNNFIDRFFLVFIPSALRSQVFSAFIYLIYYLINIYIYGQAFIIDKTRLAQEQKLLLVIATAIFSYIMIKSFKKLAQLKN